MRTQRKTHGLHVQATAHVYIQLPAIPSASTTVSHASKTNAGAACSKLKRGGPRALARRLASIERTLRRKQTFYGGGCHCGSPDGVEVLQHVQHTLQDTAFRVCNTPLDILKAMFDIRTAPSLLNIRTETPVGH